MNQPPSLEAQDYVLVWECSCGDVYIATGKREDVISEITKSTTRHRVRCGGQVRIHEPGGKMLEL